MISYLLISQVTPLSADENYLLANHPAISKTLHRSADNHAKTILVGRMSLRPNKP